MARGNQISVGVDLGSSGITCVVLERREGRPVVIGVGQAAGHGVSRGTVVHIDAMVEAIKQAVEEASIVSSCEIREVYTTVPGSQLRSFNSHGMVELRGEEVRHNDVQRVIDAARSVAIPQDQEVIHVIPQEYVVDGQCEVFDPEGMSGVCLEVWVHLITAPVAALEHTTEAFQRAKLEVRGIIVQQLAASVAVLTPDEKELGVCLLDLGAGTTNMAVFLDAALAHTKVFPVGGDHLTSDLAQILKTVNEEAERLKQKYGAAMVAEVDPDEAVTIPAVGGRPPMEVNRQFIAQVLESRLEEILALVYRELRQQDLHDRLTGGVVLTGGGALLGGVDTLAEEVLELPVRYGYPQEVGGLQPVVENPRFATAVGLALASGNPGGLGSLYYSNRRGRFGRIWSSTKNWFGEFF